MSDTNDGPAFWKPPHGSERDWKVLIACLVVKAGGRVKIEAWRLREVFNLTWYHDPQTGDLVIEAFQENKDTDP